MPSESESCTLEPQTFRHHHIYEEAVDNRYHLDNQHNLYAQGARDG